MPGPIAAASAPTAPAASATSPAASPRQPQWAMTTPWGPDIATGRQSAVTTSGVSSGDDVAWASARSGLATASATTLGRCGPSWRSRSEPWTCRAITTPSGSRPSTPASRCRFCFTEAGSSPVRIATLRASYGGSLTPPMRVENAARPAGSSASSQRTPSRSRHSTPGRLEQRSSGTGAAQACETVDGNPILFRDLVPSHGYGDPELLIATGELAVELAGERRLQPSADRWALGDARREQVRAGDLEAHPPPLRGIAVEPFRPERAGDEELRRIPVLRQTRGLGGPLGCGRRQLAELRQRPNEGEPHGQLAVHPALPGLGAGQPDDLLHPARRLRVESRHDAPVDDEADDGGRIGLARGPAELVLHAVVRHRREIGLAEQ